MSLFDKFPVILEGHITALQEHLPNQLPGYNEKRPITASEIIYLQGQQSVIQLLKQVHKTQERNKRKDA